LSVTASWLCILRRRAPYGGSAMSVLTITEYKIVTLLVSRGLHTYGTIYDAAYYVGFVAGSGKHGYSTNVRSLVKRIRRKFVAVAPGFSEIENVHKIGYRWVDSQH
jgi:two-component system, OmpR family, response regulator ChvI